MVGKYVRRAVSDFAARLATVISQKLRFFLRPQIILELRGSFPVGITESSHLFIYVY
jgi:hypothetical protein